VHAVRPAILAGILAAVGGVAVAAPISLPLQIDLPETQVLPAGALTAETRLISSLEFPEAPETASSAMPAPPVHSADGADDEVRVPEPPTALTAMGGLLFAGTVLALRRKILRQEHRPFRRRVRREYRLMA
jgi:hypothetical protein